MNIPKTLRRRCVGFTLVEMMIVVAIIAALVSLAVPQYQSYVARAQFSEALTLFSGVRTAVETHVSIYGVSNRLNEVEFLDGHRVQGEHVKEINVIGAGDSVSIVVAFHDEGISQAIAAEEVTFSWDSTDTNAGWSCSVESAVEPYASGICAAGS